MTDPITSNDQFPFIDGVENPVIADADTIAVRRLTMSEFISHPYFNEVN